MSRPSVLYVVSEPWYFANHRLDHARGLLEAGFEVHVATRTGDRFQEIVNVGCVVHELDLARGSTSFGGWIREARALRRNVRATRPDVVHAVALKPVALALTLLVGFRRPALILSINGLGISAVDQSQALVLLRWLLRLVGHLPRVELLFQTHADQLSVVGHGDLGIVIPGVGVDLDRFQPTVRPAVPPLKVVYLGRAVRSKGLTDLADAGRDPRIVECGVEIHAYCAADEFSPGALSREEIDEVSASPAIRLHEPTSDPASVLRGSHAAILPSRAGEGISKFVLEALASGVPILISAESGSGEVVEDGVTGLTFTAGDPASIADALLAVADWPPERWTEVSAVCRQVAEDSYGLNVIVPAIVDLHRRTAGVTGE